MFFPREIVMLVDGADQEYNSFIAECYLSAVEKNCQENKFFFVINVFCQEVMRKITQHAVSFLLSTLNSVTTMGMENVRFYCVYIAKHSSLTFEQKMACFYYCLRVCVN